MTKPNSIEDEKVDFTKIYYGNRNKFVNPGGIDFYKIADFTSSGKSSKRVETNTGRYWILRDGATREAIRAIKDYAVKHSYDLIATSEYLDSIGINYKDITDEIIESFSSRKK
jgi:hypothetical protein